LRRLEEVVSLHLGAGRVRGNRQEACFSRQVSMCLAKSVGGWSTTKIGRFYNGRHHTTVLHAIRKIESCRRNDPSIEALLEVLRAAPIEETHRSAPGEATPLGRLS
jgi:chromosomal replication initiator protein